VLSALAGLASGTVPVALLIAYAVSFTITVTPDSAFNVFTVGALASIAVVVGLCVGAAILAFSRAARSTGIGYLTGVGVVAVFAAVFASVWV
jgi:cysteine synthase